MTGMVVASKRSFGLFPSLHLFANPYTEKNRTSPLPNLTMDEANLWDSHNKIVIEQRLFLHGKEEKTADPTPLHLYTTVWRVNGIFLWSDREAPKWWEHMVHHVPRNIFLNDISGTGFRCTNHISLKLHEGFWPWRMIFFSIFKQALLKQAHRRLSYPYLLSPQ